MDADAGAHYRVSRLRLSELLAEQPEEVWATPIPACPGWDVRGAVSHMLGILEDAMAGRLTGPPSDAQVADQIGRHAARPAPALLDEWADAAVTFEDFVSQGGIWPVTFDVLTHEQDIRGAIDVPGAREEESMRLAARMLVAGELPVTLTFDLGDETLATPDTGGPTHTVGVQRVRGDPHPLRASLPRPGAGDGMAPGAARRPRRPVHLRPPDDPARRIGQPGQPAAARLARTSGTTSAAKRSIDGDSTAGGSPGAEPHVTTSVKPVRQMNAGQLGHALRRRCRRRPAARSAPPR